MSTPNLTKEQHRFDPWLCTAWCAYFAWGIGWIVYLTWRAIHG